MPRNYSSQMLSCVKVILSVQTSESPPCDFHQMESHPLHSQPQSPLHHYSPTHPLSFDAVTRADSLQMLPPWDRYCPIEVSLLLVSHVRHPPMYSPVVRCHCHYPYFYACLRLLMPSHHPLSVLIATAILSSPSSPDTVVFAILTPSATADHPLRIV